MSKTQGNEMIKVFRGDCLSVLKTLKSESINCCVTSPPYWGLRDYGVQSQLGLEETPEAYVRKMVKVFREVKRVLRKDGTLWLNLGDSYAVTSYLKQSGNVGAREQQKYQRGGKSTKTPAGLKPKDLVGIPWRVAFALQDDGWYLRQDIIWHKPNPMPESVRDRCTKSHEYIFLLAKSESYHFDNKAIKEKAAFWNKREDVKKGGFNSKFQQEKTRTGDYGFRAIREYRNKRSVWSVTTKSFKGAHFATFPPDLIEPCILAGCPPEGVVLDPFLGSGTTALVSKKHNRNCVGIELNPEYVQIAVDRIKNAK